jgi:ABC-2 type transport system permease protein
VRRWLGALRDGAADEWRFVVGGRSRRERSGVLMVLLAIPFLYPAVVAYLYSAEDARERPALWLDLDNSALSRQLALAVDATPEVRIVGRAASLDAGLAALRRDDAELLLVVPADLTRKVKRGERAQLAVWTETASTYLWSIAFPAVSGVVGAVDAQLSGRTFAMKGLPPGIARQRAAPIRTGDRRLFNPSGVYGHYVAVGIILVVFQQLVLISLAFSAGVKRERGLPVGEGPFPFTRFVGRAAAHAPFWLAGLAFAVLGVLPWMGWSGPSVASTGLLFLLFTAAMVPPAIAVASVAPDRMASFQVLMFFSVPLFAASGFTWPAAQLPAAVRAVTLIFPATPALRALRILSMKTGDLRAVAPQLCWLAGHALAYTALALLVVHRPRRRRGGAPSLPLAGAGPSLPAGTETTP